MAQSKLLIYPLIAWWISIVKCKRLPEGSFEPGGQTYIAIEHGPVEIVDLPMNSMVIFHS